MTPAISRSDLGGGTLVVMVPTDAGLIVAADSRLTVLGGNLVCDNMYKIAEPQGVDRTAIVVTGNSIVRDLGPLIGKLLVDVCDLMQKIIPTFDALEMVRGLIERQPTLATEKFDDLARLCADRVLEYMAADPGVFDSLKGANIFQVALGSYSPAERASYIRSFNVDLSQSGAPVVTKLKIQRFLMEDPSSLSPFGEVNFLMQQVFAGPGLRFLGERYGRFRSKEGTKVADIDITTAADFASELIEAAEKTSQIVPPPTGIGGPVDIVLVGEDPRPKRLRWK